VVVNPLVNWIWAGFAILALGTIIALLPERAFASATSTVPSSAATTSLLVVVGLVLASGHVHAQHVETPGLVLRAPSSVLERELQSEIICMCGTCGRKRIGECTCGLAAQMREELAGLVAKGMNRDQVYEYYIAKYGSQEPLASPIDKGFNRLAWAVPYGLGLFGAAFAGALALRWSRARHTAEEPAGGEQAVRSREWDERLDEELRDLD